MLKQNTSLYALNIHRRPRWYYNFESSSSIKKKGMSHYLVVYAFLCYPREPFDSGPRAVVIGKLASPAFQMKSQRGGDAGRSNALAEEDDPLSRLKDCSDDSCASTPVSKKRKSEEDPSIDQALWWRHHSDDSKRVLQLHVVFTLLNRLSLYDVSFCLNPLSLPLRKRWFDKIVRNHCNGVVSPQLMDLQRAFTLKAFAKDSLLNPESVPYAHPDTTSVITVCVDVLLALMVSDAVPGILQAMWNSQIERLNSFDGDQARALFVQFARRLHIAIDFTIRNRATASRSPNQLEAVRFSKGLSGLVDDVMSAVFREKRLQPLRSNMAHTLSDGGCASERWFRVFVSQLRVATVQRKIDRANTTADQPTMWTDKWILDTRSYRVHYPSQATLGSVVSWVVVLHQWMAVGLEMEGNTLSISSLLADSTCQRMKLILDKRQRIFSCFPDGISSIASFDGGDLRAWVHGDYVGTVISPNELQCQTYSLRQHSCAEILRTSVKASVWAMGYTSKRCVVSIQFATANCEQWKAEQIISWPVSARFERLYAALKWTPIASVDVTYHDLPTPKLTR